MSTREMLPYAAFASHAWKEDNGRDNHALVMAVVAALQSAPHNIKIWLDAEEMGAGSVTAQMSRGIESSEIALIFLSRRYIDGVDRNWAPGKEWDNCEREYLEILKTKRYLRVVPIIMDVELRNQQLWGKKPLADLADLFYYDISMLFDCDSASFTAKVAELATAIEQTRAGEAKLKRYALRRVLQSDAQKKLPLPDAMAGAKLHGVEPVQRDWVLKEVKEWYQQRNWTRAFVILGDAGMGKSVLAAMLALHGGTVLDNVPRRVSLRSLIKRFSRRGSAQPESFTVGATHFFDYGNANTSNVRAVIYSIANQLCGAVPGLQAQIFAGPDPDALDNIKDVAELFRTVVARPCRAVATPPAGRVVVILDALDECEKSARAQLLGILQTTFLRECPLWLGFLATSRKDDYTPLVLSVFNPTVLDAEQRRNEGDLRLYFERRLKSCGLDGADLKEGTQVLTRRSEGLFLYARFADDTLKRLDRDKSVTLAAIKDERNFALGMSDVYVQYFSRFKERCLGGSDTLYELVLGALVVAREPLPLPLLERAMGFSSGRKRRDFAEAARNLLIVGDDSTLRFVHKSMADWLSGVTNKTARRDLIVEPDEGHVQLAALCEEQSGHAFALRHALHHLCSAGRMQDAAAHLLDITWLVTALQAADPMELVIDADPYLDKPGEPAGDVLRVLEKGVNALRRSPREIASQLYGRLEKPHPALQSIDLGFEGSWLKPVQPTLTPAHHPLRKTFVGHERGVDSVGYCHQLDMVVSASQDATVKVWKASTGQLLRTLDGHSGAVTSVGVSAELDMIVSGSADKTAKVWKASTGQLLRTLEGHAEEVNSVTVSTELDMIVSGSTDKTVKVWKASTDQLLRTLEGHAGEVKSVTVSTELDIVVSGSTDKTVKVWKASTGQLLRTIEGHSASVNGVAVAADMIVSGASDETVKVWQASTGRLLRTLEGHSSTVNSVAVSAELDVIVSGSGFFLSSDNTVKVWQASSGQLLRTFQGHADYVRSVTLSAELNVVVSGSSDKTVKVWTASTAQPLRTLERHERRVTGVAVSVELDVVVSGSADAKVKVWRASTGKLLQTIDGHLSTVNTVAVSAEMDMIVSGTGDVLSQVNTVKVWRASTGKLLRTLEGHKSAVLSVAVSAELDIIVSGSDDKTAKVWRASTGQLLRTLTGHSSRVVRVAVVAGGITSRDSSGAMLCWDGRTFEPLQPGGDRTLSPWTARDLDVQDGYHVTLRGTDCADFSTDAAVTDVDRADDVVAVGDESGLVHVLYVT